MKREPLVYGVTVDQIDELSSLLHTLCASGDMIAISDGNPMDPRTLPTLGYAIFSAAIAARDIADQIGAQRLPIRN
jgi:hypothetical protein